MIHKSVQQKSMLIKRTKKRCLLLLGFLLLFVWFGIRLVATESPTEWQEADIMVADIQQASLKPNLWQIIDTEGNTYSAYESDAVIEQILPQSTYHIVYSPYYHNGIRAITQGDTVIVDYVHSVSVHCERNIWDWFLAFLGLTGSLATIVCMVIDMRKVIIQG